MAKPRHISKATESNRGKRLGLRRRIDVTQIPKKQQKDLIAFALRIQELVAVEDRNELSDDLLQATAIELRKKPWEVRAAIAQFRSYHTAHAGQHPANAFTPAIRNQSSEKLTEPTESISGTQPGNTKRQPSRGMALALVPEPEQSQIKAFAERIHALNQLKRDFGRVPRHEREHVATEFGCTVGWISQSMQRQQAYLAAYPDEPFYHAHTPRQVGRPKGRTAADEVREAIELARINKRWLSRNGAAGYDEMTNVIEKKLIHSLVIRHFGEIHSESTTYRIIRDYEERRAARVAVAENDAGILQTKLPTISNKTQGPGIRGQFDARPLPVVVDNDGVPCSVHALLVFEDFTGHIPSWDLIPAKRIDDNQEIHKQTFTDQRSRATVARGVMRIGRFRLFYADHGYEALKNYMPFMVSAGEDPTELIHSRRARPRGRGTVEHGVQLIDGFLKTRPHYVRERDFRRSRKKKQSAIKPFAMLYEDFAAYIHCWNTDPAPGGGSSREELLKQGPSFFLTAPALENLAIFALGKRREQRVPRRDGDVWFWIDTQGYEAYRRDRAIYEQFANVVDRGAKIDITVFQLGLRSEDQIVLFSLDGERTWELAVPAGSGTISGRRHTEILVEVEQQLEHSDALSLDAFFQKIILGSTKGPLVLNGIARERHFYHHSPPPPALPSEEPQKLMDEMLALPADTPPAESRSPEAESDEMLVLPADTPPAESRLPEAESNEMLVLPAVTPSAESHLPEAESAVAPLSNEGLTPSASETTPPVAESLSGDKSTPEEANIQTGTPPVAEQAPPAVQPRVPNFIEELRKRRQQGGS